MGRKPETNRIVMLQQNSSLAVLGQSGQTLNQRTLNPKTISNRSVHTVDFCKCWSSWLSSTLRKRKVKLWDYTRSILPEKATLLQSRFIHARVHIHIFARTLMTIAELPIKFYSLLL